MIDGAIRRFYEQGRERERLTHGTGPLYHLTERADRVISLTEARRVLRPDELGAEVVESGLVLDTLLGVEGPGGFVGDGWNDPRQHSIILRAARLVEQEASLLGLSPHLLAVARKSH